MVPRVEVSTEVVIFAEVEPSVVISGSKYTFVVPAVDGTIVDVSNSTPVELTEGVISAEVVPRVAVSAEKEPRIVVSAKVLETVVTSVVFSGNGAQGCTFHRSAAKHSHFYRCGSKCSNSCRSGRLNHCGFNCRC